jgi:aryl-alcohol dehydrogenase-like predicted oxidoreductase
MAPMNLGQTNEQIPPIGFGGMPLSIQGRPSTEQAKKTLHAAIDAGMTFIDTADVYCLDDFDTGHNERLIASVLRERSDGKSIQVATKAGLERPNGAWTRNGSPEHLREACDQSLNALGVEQIWLYQYHAPDEKFPFEESVGAFAELQRAGKCKHVGLSNVTVEQIESAQKVVRRERDHVPRLLPPRRRTPDEETAEVRSAADDREEPQRVGPRRDDRLGSRPRKERRSDSCRTHTGARDR